MVENNKTCESCKHIMECASVSATIKFTSTFDELKSKKDCSVCERYEEVKVPHGTITTKQDGIDDDFQIVACSHGDTNGLYLFEAPITAELKKGDEVLAENRRGGKRVVKVWYSIKASEITDEAMQLIFNLASARLPLCKILGKYYFEPFEQEENKTERKPTL